MRAQGVKKRAPYLGSVTKNASSVNDCEKLAKCTKDSTVMSLLHFHLYITYRGVALQPQLIFKGRLILQEIKIISKILQKSIYNC